MNTEEPEPAAQARERSRLERWLGSWRGRQVFVWSAVLFLTALSASVWAEAIESMGRSVDLGYLVGRRFIDWALWGVLFEPIFQLSKWLAVRFRSWFVPLVLHAVMAIGATFAVSELDPVLTEALVGPPPWRRGPDAFAVEPSDGPLHPPGGRDRPSWERFNPRRIDRGFFFYFVILGVGWGIQGFLRTREQERRAHGLELHTTRLEKELVDAQLTNLRHQLHPHFLFNSLHSVGGLVREGRDQVALNTLSDLGNLLRAAFDQREQEVALRDELDLLDSYLEIEKLRLGDRLNVSTRFEAGLGALPVPALILLPLVENAIKYGIAPRPAGGSLEVSVSRTDGLLRIEVLDDGPGFPPELLSDDARPPERVGIGIENTRRRLAALYGDRGSLSISNPPAGGARAVVSIRVQAAPGAARPS